VIWGLRRRESIRFLTDESIVFLMIRVRIVAEGNVKLKGNR